MKNVALRIKRYNALAGDDAIKAFINCGGSYYNLGTHAQVLTVGPGLHRSLKLVPESTRGMLYAMAARGIPVIHLLNIRDLVRRHGLPWDPVPLPAAGSAFRTSELPTGFYILAACYFILLGLNWLLFRNQRIH